MSTSSYQAEGFHAITPSLTIKGAAAAIDFYIKAFGAAERFRLADDNGTVMHAEMQFGDSVVMLSDEFPSFGALSPATIGGMGGSLMFYVPDVDAAYARAVAAGATSEMPPTTQFWGDRCAYLRDPFGHKWSLATHIEDVPPDEMSRRAAEWVKQVGS
ncbi:MAG: VOC family protein [Verrucomicrobiales bacterium]